MALGVAVPQWEHFEQGILSDLTTKPPYGIGWWAPSPGTSRRILISDQLYSCATSVQTNLIEAVVHWLEFLDWRDREDDFNAGVVAIVDGKPKIKAPPRSSALEDLGVDLVRLHTLGVVRALSGSLDCTAGAIIGALALPSKILRADFVSVRKLLVKKAGVEPTDDGEKLQRDFAARLEELIARAGPSGWLDWVLAFRNMLVHRGRRIEIGQFVPRKPVLLDPDSEEVPRARVITHLPLDPWRSDVEVFLDTALSPVLTEDAQQTLQGVIASTRRLVDEIAVQLIEVWEWRRAHPELLRQPVEQWPDGPSTSSQDSSAMRLGVTSIPPACS